MGEWEGQWRIWNSGAVMKLAHKKEISCQETAFHRGSGNRIGLEKENADKGGRNYRKSYSIGPFSQHPFASRLLKFLIGNIADLAVQPHPGEKSKRYNHSGNPIPESVSSKAFGQIYS